MKHSDRITLYTVQRKVVTEIVQSEGIYYVQRSFIRSKYGESAPFFLTVYDWYARRAAEIVPRPPEAESAVWAFPDRTDAAAYEDSCLLTLEVPRDEVVFFDMLEWTRLLNLQCLGSEEERRLYQERLAEQGVTDPTRLITTSFYPLLKRELLQSWSHLFRHHASIQQGDSTSVDHVQAGLWCIRKEWVTNSFAND